MSLALYLQVGEERFHAFYPFGEAGGPAGAFEPKPCFEALKADLGVSSERGLYPTLCG